MKEQDYQRKVIKRYEKNGYYVINLIKTNKHGISDLLALKAGEPPTFIEMKGLNGKLSKLQEYRLNEQKALGFNVYYSKGDQLIEWQK